MKRVGLIGNPVAHSRSPQMQNAALQAANIDAVYELWQTEAEDIEDRVRSIRDEAIAGANVTVPHKQAVMPYLDDISETAQLIGAVNTIIPVSGRLIGDNTDAYGFAASIYERYPNFSPVTAIVLGAGGASRAVIVALKQMGATDVIVVNRTLAKAESLAAEFGVASAEWSVLDVLLPRANVLVNATSLGWHDEEVVPAEMIALLPEESLIVDLTYRDTPLLQVAADNHLRALDGLGMLIHQGARSFELWFGREPGIDVMRQALDND